MPTAADDGPPISLESLPSRDKIQFRAVSRLYDDQKYLKAAKGLDLLLKKYPTCIELLSLKCLVLRNIPQKEEEALAAVKYALKLDLRSAVAWHALGSYHKLNAAYRDALTGYKRAVACNPSNPQLLNDLSNLQFFLRQYDAYLESRQKILQLCNDEKKNWFAIPLALHLSGKPKEAAELLLKWWELPREIVDECTASFDAELRLYLLRLLEESNQYERALHHVQAILEIEKAFPEKWNLLTFKGRVELKMGALATAEKTYKQLVEYLPENTDYLLAYCMTQSQLQRFCPNPYQAGQEWMLKLSPAIVNPGGVVNGDWLSFPLYPSSAPGMSGVVDKMGRRKMNGQTKIFWYKGALWELLFLRESDITLSEEEAVIDTANDLIQMLGRTPDAVAALPLAFIRSESNFRYWVERLFSTRLRKGSPAVFAMVEIFFYVEGPRNVWAFETILSTCRSLEKEQPMCEALAAGIEALWFAFVKDDEAKALDIIERAIEAVPTFVELHTLHGRILSHFCRYSESAKSWEKARTLELADRYLNDAAAKASFDANDLETGFKLVALFQKPSEMKDRGQVIDIQNMAIEYSAAQAHLRLGNIWNAAARFEKLVRRFGEMKADSMNFHLYTLRRGALRGLVDYMQLMNRLTSHYHHYKSAIKLVDLCLRFGDGEKVERAKEDEGFPTNASYDFNSVGERVEEAKLILGKLRAYCGVGNFQINQRTYMAYALSGKEEQEGEKKVMVLVQALHRLWRLCNKETGHPKIFPYLFHFLHKYRELCSGGEDLSVRRLCDELQLSEESMRMGLKSLAESHHIKDVLAAFRGVLLVCSMPSCDQNLLISILRESLRPQKIREQNTRLDLSRSINRFRQTVLKNKAAVDDQVASLFDQMCKSISMTTFTTN